MPPPAGEVSLSPGSVPRPLHKHYKGKAGLRLENGGHALKVSISDSLHSTLPEGQRSIDM